MHFYDDFENIQVTKIKLKKLLVKCLYKFNNNLYAAGRNCTKVPLLKPTTTRREIYIMKNFDLSNPYVIPDDKIAIPDSPNDIEVMLGQNPYLFVYCRPSIHLVNLRTNQVRLMLGRSSQHLIAS
ncbi:MAG: hypothetical protein JST59_02640 [Actinobacteria bacterium]|nr:hypothetical protein [Actinomycetota bacterium]